MTGRRYYDVDDANRLIPELERTFGRMLQIQAQIKSGYRRLERAGFAPRDEDFDLQPPGATPEVTGDLATLRTLIDGLRSDLEDLMRRGCLVKGIEEGLVDWYTRTGDGRDVLLCWKLGEKEIGFWHEIDAGFAGRRPLSEL